MVKLEDPCPFCKSRIDYYPSRTMPPMEGSGLRVECYCTNIKCRLQGLRTLSESEYRKLLAMTTPLNPPKQ